MFAAAGVALGFLLFPLVAIFARVSPARLVGQLSRPVVTDALRLSLETSAIALALIVLVGTPAAYLLASRRFRGRSLVLTAIELPLVMPPAVAGIALLAAFGPKGILGGAIEGAGVELVFETAGVVVALVFVSAPFFLRAAIAAFEAIDPRLLEAARTLGAGSGRIIAEVLLPGALPSIVSGLRVSAGLGWQSLIGAELIVVSSGIGFVLVQGQSNLAPDIVMSAMLAVGVVGLLIDVGLRAAERRIRRRWGQAA